MNKFLSAVVALSVAAVPVAAQAQDRHHRWEDNRRGGLSVGEGIALGVGIAVLGSIISDRGNRRNIERRLPTEIDPFGDVDPYNIYRPRCIREQVVWTDAFGRFRRTFQYRCNR